MSFRDWFVGEYILLNHNGLIWLSYGEFSPNDNLKTTAGLPEYAPTSQRRVPVSNRFLVHDLDEGALRRTVPDR